MDNNDFKYKNVLYGFLWFFVFVDAASFDEAFFGFGRRFVVFGVVFVAKSSPARSQHYENVLKIFDYRYVNFCKTTNRKGIYSRFDVDRRFST